MKEDQLRTVTMRKATFTAYLLFASLVLAAQTTKLSETVHFDTDQSTLPPESVPALQKIVDNLLEADDYSISIFGHTDLVGDSLYNHKLSQKRAQSISDFFSEKGVPKNRISLKGHGYNQPIASGSNKDNRRAFVEAIIHKEIEEEPEDVADVAELYKMLASPPQVFSIDPSKDTVVVADGGTIVCIRARSFRKCNPGEAVELRLKESIQRSEMLMDNLTTTTNGRLLISEGMLRARAYCNGKEIRITKDLLVMSPTDTINPEVDLYRGQHQKEGNINWRPTGRSGGFIGLPCWDNDVANRTRRTVERCPFFFCQIRKFFKRDIPPAAEIYLCDERSREFEEKYKDYSLEQLQDIPNEDLKYYVFRQRAGWTNLDWMYKVEDRVPFALNIPPSKNLDIKLVFKRNRSIAGLERARTKYYFRQGAPNGEEAWLVALKFEDDQPYLAIKDIEISQSSNYDDLDFKAYSIADLRKELEVLNQF